MINEVEFLQANLDRNDLAIKNIFSKEESNFILKNIISKYALEEKVVKEFLKRKERLSVAEITEIFSQIQNMFIEEWFGPGGEKISFKGIIGIVLVCIGIFLIK